MVFGLNLTTMQHVTRSGLSCRTIVLTIFWGLPVLQHVQAQTIKLSGFIKAESIFDTRQVLQIREGQLNLYPLPDDEGNRQNNLLMAAFQSRMQVNITEAKALGAGVTGLIEADFFGSSNASVSTLQLRHAWAKLEWTRHEVLMGQSWSPLFAPVMPQTINFSTGAPFQPFARFPQVSYTWKPGVFRLAGTLTQQRDAFSDIGGNKQQQQSGLPSMHVHGQVARGSMLAGVGTTVKTIRPDLTGKRFTAWAVQSYARVDLKKVDLRSKVTYGNDLTDHLMTGGYVKTEGGEYEPLEVASGWVDLSTISRPFGAGLFAGYLTNRGARCDVTVATESTRAPNMEYLWRLSPRISYISGPVRLALEVEATSALYCSTYDPSFKPTSTGGDKAITNLRVLAAAFLTF